ncbi:GntR family transcriptional regulator [Kocuria carniphila]|uniref:GntR family transcriptional regulator n=1 Tax=Kocuria carniphila TaxID=262208 RepID=UPI0034DACF65
MTSNFALEPAGAAAISSATAPSGTPTALAAEGAQASALAAGRLRARISGGQLAPGAKLSEQAIARELGVSRNTLREAFTVLTGESLVDRVPNRGVFVARPTADDVREIYSARRIIEPGAVLWGSCPSKILTELKAVIASARSAREAGDIKGMGDANQRFHRGLMALTGSATLVTTMDRLLARMRLVFHSMSADPGFHGDYVDRNAELLRLLEAGQRAEAAEALREYLTFAEAQLLEHMA